MKKTLNVFWIVSAVFLAIGAFWGVIPGSANVMRKDIVCGIALIVFGVISVLAFFTAGVKAAASGWYLFDGVISFATGLAYVFSFVETVLFNVGLIYILGLWVIFLGMTQIVRASHLSRSFGRVLISATGVLSILGGLSFYVKPVSDLLLISESMMLCSYSATFVLLLAAVMVLCRCVSGRR